MLRSSAEWSASLLHSRVVLADVTASSQVSVNQGFTTQQERGAQGDSWLHVLETLMSQTFFGSHLGKRTSSNSTSGRQLVAGSLDSLPSS